MGQFDQFANQGGAAAWDPDERAEAKRVAEEQLNNADLSGDFPEPLPGGESAQDTLMDGTSETTNLPADAAADIDSAAAAANAADADADPADTADADAADLSGSGGPAPSSGGRNGAS